MFKFELDLKCKGEGYKVNILFLNRTHYLEVTPTD